MRGVLLQGESPLHLVEAFFSIISRQAMRCTFASVPDLVDAIRTFIDAYNERCEPFVRTSVRCGMAASAMVARPGDSGIPPVVIQRSSAAHRGSAWSDTRGT